jgi:hypothetical protein
VALVALVLIAAFDQAVYGLAGVDGWRDLAPRAEIVSKLADDGPLPPAGAYRVSCCPFPNLYTLAGYQMIEGYVGLVPVRHLSYHTNATLRLAQVEYVHQSTFKAARIQSADAISPDWYRLPPPLPRARLVSEARVSSRPDEDIETLDIDHAALVTHPVGLSKGEPGTAAIVHDEPGAIHVDTSATGVRLLVLSEMFEDRWSATLDGASARVEQVNGDFLGCVVPAGVHKVILEFDPRYREVGGPISIAATAVVALLAAAGGWRPRAFRRQKLAFDTRPALHQ